MKMKFVHTFPLLLPKIHHLWMLLHFQWHVHHVNLAIRKEAVWFYPSFTNNSFASLLAEVKPVWKLTNTIKIKNTTDWWKQNKIQSCKGITLKYLPSWVFTRQRRLENSPFTTHNSWLTFGSLWQFLFKFGACFKIFSCNVTPFSCY